MNIRTLFLCLTTLVIQIRGLVQLNNSLANSDSPLLMKILQSIDAATSDEHLLDVTLKLLNSLCHCMRESLRAKEDSYSSNTNVINPSEEHISDGKVLDLYKKIYNNTCFNLRQELSKRNQSSEVSYHSNCSKENISNHHGGNSRAVRNALRSKLEHILYKALVLTRRHHKYKIKRYNLFGKARAKAKSSLKHSLIVILTLHPKRKDISLGNYSIAEEDLHKILHGNSSIEIDIIDTKYDNKQKESTEVPIEQIFLDCHLQSLYTYLVESELKNLTKVFRFIRRHDTIKIYIEVITGRNHSDYINICCENGMITEKCRTDAIKDLDSSEDSGNDHHKHFDRKKFLEFRNHYQSTISKIEKLVENINVKLMNNVTNVTQRNSDNNNTSNSFKDMPTTKIDNNTTGHLDLKANRVPNSKDSLKLRDVSQAIIMLNDFVSRQATKMNLRPAESNTTNLHQNKTPVQDLLEIPVTNRNTDSQTNFNENQAKDKNKTQTTLRPNNKNPFYSTTTSKTTQIQDVNITKGFKMGDKKIETPSKPSINFTENLPPTTTSKPVRNISDDSSIKDSSSKEFYITTTKYTTDISEPYLQMAKTLMIKSASEDDSLSPDLTAKNLDQIIKSYTTFNPNNITKKINRLENTTILADKSNETIFDNKLTNSSNKIDSQESFIAIMTTEETKNDILNQIKETTTEKYDEISRDMMPNSIELSKNISSLSISSPIKTEDLYSKVDTEVTNANLQHIKDTTHENDNRITLIQADTTSVPSLESNITSDMTTLKIDYLTGNNGNESMNESHLLFPQNVHSNHSIFNERIDEGRLSNFKEKVNYSSTVNVTVNIKTSDKLGDNDIQFTPFVTVDKYSFTNAYKTEPTLASNNLAIDKKDLISNTESTLPQTQLLNTTTFEDDNYLSQISILSHKNLTGQMEPHYPKSDNVSEDIDELTPHTTQKTDESNNINDLITDMNEFKMYNQLSDTHNKSIIYKVLPNVTVTTNKNDNGIVSTQSNEIIKIGTKSNNNEISQSPTYSTVTSDERTKAQDSGNYEEFLNIKEDTDNVLFKNTIEQHYGNNDTLFFDSMKVDTIDTAFILSTTDLVEFTNLDTFDVTVEPLDTSDEVKKSKYEYDLTDIHTTDYSTLLSNILVINKTKDNNVISNKDITPPQTQLFDTENITSFKEDQYLPKITIISEENFTDQMEPYYQVSANISERRNTTKLYNIKKNEKENMLNLKLDELINQNDSVTGKNTYEINFELPNISNDIMVNDVLPSTTTVTKNANNDAIGTSKQNEIIIAANSETNKTEKLQSSTYSTVTSSEIAVEHNIVKYEEFSQETNADNISFITPIEQNDKNNTTSLNFSLKETTIENDSFFTTVSLDTDEEFTNKKQSNVATQPSDIAQEDKKNILNKKSTLLQTQNHIFENTTPYTKDNHLPEISMILDKSLTDEMVPYHIRSANIPEDINETTPYEKKIEDHKYISVLKAAEPIDPNNTVTGINQLQINDELSNAHTDSTINNVLPSTITVTTNANDNAIVTAKLNEIIIMADAATNNHENSQNYIYSTVTSDEIEVGQSIDQYQGFSLKKNEDNRSLKTPTGKRNKTNDSALIASIKENTIENDLFFVTASLHKIKEFTYVKPIDVAMPPLDFADEANQKVTKHSFANITENPVLLKHIETINKATPLQTQLYKTENSTSYTIDNNLSEISMILDNNLDEMGPHHNKSANISERRNETISYENKKEKNEYNMSVFTTDEPIDLNDSITGRNRSQINDELSNDHTDSTINNVLLSTVTVTTNANDDAIITAKPNEIIVTVDSETNNLENSHNSIYSTVTSDEIEVGQNIDQYQGFSLKKDTDNKSLKTPTGQSNENNDTSLIASIKENTIANDSFFVTASLAKVKEFTYVKPNDVTMPPLDLADEANKKITKHSFVNFTQNPILLKNIETINKITPLQTQLHNTENTTSFTKDNYLSENFMILDKNLTDKLKPYHIGSANIPDSINKTTPDENKIEDHKYISILEAAEIIVPNNTVTAINQLYTDSTINNILLSTITVTTNRNGDAIVTAKPNKIIVTADAETNNQKNLQNFIYSTVTSDEVEVEQSIAKNQGYLDKKDMNNISFETPMEKSNKNNDTSLTISLKENSIKINSFFTTASLHMDEKFADEKPIEVAMQPANFSDEDIKKIHKHSFTNSTENSILLKNIETRDKTKYKNLIPKIETTKLQTQLHVTENTTSFTKDLPVITMILDKNLTDEMRPYHLGSVNISEGKNETISYENKKDKNEYISVFKADEPVDSNDSMTSRNHLQIDDELSNADIYSTINNVLPSTITVIKNVDDNAIFTAKPNKIIIMADSETNNHDNSQNYIYSTVKNKEMEEGQSIDQYQGFSLKKDTDNKSLKTPTGKSNENNETSLIASISNDSFFATASLPRVEEFTYVKPIDVAMPPLDFADKANQKITKYSFANFTDNPFLLKSIDIIDRTEYKNLIPNKGTTPLQTQLHGTENSTSFTKEDYLSEISMILDENLTDEMRPYHMGFANISEGRNETLPYEKKVKDHNYISVLKAAEPIDPNNTVTGINQLRINDELSNAHIDSTINNVLPSTITVPKNANDDAIVTDRTNEKIIMADAETNNHENIQNFIYSTVTSDEVDVEQSIAKTQGYSQNKDIDNMSLKNPIEQNNKNKDTSLIISTKKIDPFFTTASLHTDEEFKNVKFIDVAMQPANFSDEDIKKMYKHSFTNSTENPILLKNIETIDITKYKNFIPNKETTTLQTEHHITENTTLFTKDNYLSEISMLLIRNQTDAIGPDHMEFANISEGRNETLPYGNKKDKTKDTITGNNQLQINNELSNAYIYSTIINVLPGKITVTTNANDYANVTDKTKEIVITADAETNNHENLHNYIYSTITSDKIKEEQNIAKYQGYSQNKDVDNISLKTPTGQSNKNNDTSLIISIKADSLEIDSFLTTASLHTAEEFINKEPIDVAMQPSIISNEDYQKIYVHSFTNSTENPILLKNIETIDKTKYKKFIINKETTPLQSQLYENKNTTSFTIDNYLSEIPLISDKNPTDKMGPYITIPAHILEDINKTTPYKNKKGKNKYMSVFKANESIDPNNLVTGINQLQNNDELSNAYTESETNGVLPSSTYLTKNDNDDGNVRTKLNKFIGTADSETNEHEKFQNSLPKSKMKEEVEQNVAEYEEFSKLIDIDNISFENSTEASNNNNDTSLTVSVKEKTIEIDTLLTTASLLNNGGFTNEKLIDVTMHHIGIADKANKPEYENSFTHVNYTKYPILLNNTEESNEKGDINFMSNKETTLLPTQAFDTKNITSLEQKINLSPNTIISVMNLTDIMGKYNKGLSEDPESINKMTPFENKKNVKEDAMSAFKTDELNSFAEISLNTHPELISMLIGPNDSLTDINSCEMNDEISITNNDVLHTITDIPTNAINDGIVNTKPDLMNGTVEYKINNTNKSQNSTYSTVMKDEMITTQTSAEYKTFSTMKEVSDNVLYQNTIEQNYDNNDTLLTDSMNLKNIVDTASISPSTNIVTNVKLKKLVTSDVMIQPLDISDEVKKTKYNVTDILKTNYPLSNTLQIDKTENTNPMLNRDTTPQQTQLFDPENITFFKGDNYLSEISVIFNKNVTNEIEPYNANISEIINITKPYENKINENENMSVLSINEPSDYVTDINQFKINVELSNAHTDSKINYVLPTPTTPSVTTKADDDRIESKWNENTITINPTTNNNKKSQSSSFFTVTNGEMPVAQILSEYSKVKKDVDKISYKSPIDQTYKNNDTSLTVSMKENTIEIDTSLLKNVEFFNKNSTYVPMQPLSIAEKATETGHEYSFTHVDNTEYPILLHDTVAIDENKDLNLISRERENMLQTQLIGNKKTTSFEQDNYLSGISIASGKNLTDAMEYYHKGFANIPETITKHTTYDSKINYENHPSAFKTDEVNPTEIIINTRPELISMVIDPNDPITEKNTFNINDKISNVHNDSRINVILLSATVTTNKNIDETKLNAISNADDYNTSSNEKLVFSMHSSEDMKVTQNLAEHKGFTTIKEDVDNNTIIEQSYGKNDVSLTDYIKDVVETDSTLPTTNLTNDAHVDITNMKSLDVTIQPSDITVEIDKTSYKFATTGTTSKLNMTTSVDFIDSIIDMGKSVGSSTITSEMLSKTTSSYSNNSSFSYNMPQIIKNITSKLSMPKSTNRVHKIISSSNVVSKVKDLINDPKNVADILSSIKMVNLKYEPLTQLTQIMDHKIENITERSTLSLINRLNYIINTKQNIAKTDKSTHDKNVKANIADISAKPNVTRLYKISKSNLKFIVNNTELHTSPYRISTPRSIMEKLPSQSSLKNTVSGSLAQLYSSAHDDTAITTSLYHIIINDTNHSVKRTTEEPSLNRSFKAIIMIPESNIKIPKQLNTVSTVEPKYLKISEKDNPTNIAQKSDWVDIKSNTQQQQGSNNSSNETTMKPLTAALSTKAMTSDLKSLTNEMLKTNDLTVSTIKTIKETESTNLGNVQTYIINVTHPVLTPKITNITSKKKKQIHDMDDNFSTKEGNKIITKGDLKIYNTKLHTDINSNKNSLAVAKTINPRIIGINYNVTKADLLDNTKLETLMTYGYTTINQQPEPIISTRNTTPYERSLALWTTRSVPINSNSAANIIAINTLPIFTDKFISHTRSNTTTLEKQKLITENSLYFTTHLKTETTTEIAKHIGINITKKSRSDSFLHLPDQQELSSMEVIQNYVTPLKLNDTKIKKTARLERGTVHYNQLETIGSIDQPGIKGTQTIAKINTNPESNLNLIKSDVTIPDPLQLTLHVGIETSKNGIQFSLVNKYPKLKNNHKIRAPIFVKNHFTMPMSTYRRKNTKLGSQNRKFLNLSRRANIIPPIKLLRNNKLTTFAKRTKELKKIKLSSVVKKQSSTTPMIKSNNISIIRIKPDLIKTKNQKTKIKPPRIILKKIQNLQGKIIYKNATLTDDKAKNVSNLQTELTSLKKNIVETTEKPTTPLNEKQKFTLMDNSTELLVTNISVIGNTSNPLKRKHKKIVIKPNSLTNQLTMENIKAFYQLHVQKKMNKNESFYDSKENRGIPIIVTKDALFSKSNNQKDPMMSFKGEGINKELENKNIIKSLNDTELNNTSSLFQDENINNTNINNYTTTSEEPNAINLSSSREGKSNENISKFVPRSVDNSENETISKASLEKPETLNKSINNMTSIKETTAKYVKEGKNGLSNKKKKFSKANRSKRIKILNALKRKNNLINVVKKLVKAKKIDAKKLKGLNKTAIIQNLLSYIKNPNKQKPKNDTQNTYAANITTENTTKIDTTTNKYTNKTLLSTSHPNTNLSTNLYKSNKSQIYLSQLEKPAVGYFSEFNPLDSFRRKLSISNNKTKVYSDKSVDYLNSIITTSPIQNIKTSLEYNENEHFKLNKIKNTTSIITSNIILDKADVKNDQNSINGQFKMESTNMLIDDNIFLPNIIRSTQQIENRDLNNFWANKPNEVNQVNSTTSFNLLHHNSTMQNINPILPIDPYYQLEINNNTKQLTKMKSISNNTVGDTTLTQNIITKYTTPIADEQKTRDAEYTKNINKPENYSEENLDKTTSITKKLGAPYKKKFVTININIPYLTLLKSTMPGLTREVKKEIENIDIKQQTIEDQQETIPNILLDSTEQTNLSLNDIKTTNKEEELLLKNILSNTILTPKNDTTDSIYINGNISHENEMNSYLKTPLGDYVTRNFSLMEEMSNANTTQITKYILEDNFKSLNNSSDQLIDDIENKYTTLPSVIANSTSSNAFVKYIASIEEDIHTKAYTNVGNISSSFSSKDAGFNTLDFQFNSKRDVARRTIEDLYTTQMTNDSHSVFKPIHLLNNGSLINTTPIVDNIIINGIIDSDDDVISIFTSKTIINASNNEHKWFQPLKTQNLSMLQSSNKINDRNENKNFSNSTQKSIDTTTTLSNLTLIIKNISKVKDPNKYNGDNLTEKNYTFGNVSTQSLDKITSVPTSSTSINNDTTETNSEENKNFKPLIISRSPSGDTTTYEPLTTNLLVIQNIDVANRGINSEIDGDNIDMTSLTSSLTTINANKSKENVNNFESTNQTKSYTNAYLENSPIKPSLKMEMFPSTQFIKDTDTIDGIIHTIFESRKSQDMKSNFQTKPSIPKGKTAISKSKVDLRKRKKLAAKHNAIKVAKKTNIPLNMTSLMKTKIKEKLSPNKITNFKFTFPPSLKNTLTKTEDVTARISSQGNAWSALSINTMNKKHIDTFKTKNQSITFGTTNKTDSKINMLTTKMTDFPKYTSTMNTTKIHKHNKTEVINDVTLTEYHNVPKTTQNHDGLFETTVSTISMKNLSHKLNISTASSKANNRFKINTNWTTVGIALTEMNTSKLVNVGEGNFKNNNYSQNDQYGLVYQYNISTTPITPFRTHKLPQYQKKETTLKNHDKVSSVTFNPKSTNKNILTNIILGSTTTANGKYNNVLFTNNGDEADNTKVFADLITKPDIKDIMTSEVSTKLLKDNNLETSILKNITENSKRLNNETEDFKPSYMSNQLNTTTNLSIFDIGSKTFNEIANVFSERSHNFISTLKPNIGKKKLNNQQSFQNNDYNSNSILDNVIITTKPFLVIESSKNNLTPGKITKIIPNVTNSHKTPYIKDKNRIFKELDSGIEVTNKNVQVLIGNTPYLESKLNLTKSVEFHTKPMIEIVNNTVPRNITQAMLSFSVENNKTALLPYNNKITVPKNFETKQNFEMTSQKLDFSNSISKMYKTQTMDDIEITASKKNTLLGNKTAVTHSKNNIRFEITDSLLQIPKYANDVKLLPESTTALKFNHPNTPISKMNKNNRDTKVKNLILNPLPPSILYRTLPLNNDKNTIKYTTAKFNQPVIEYNKKEQPNKKLTLLEFKENPTANTNLTSYNTLLIETSTNQVQELFLNTMSRLTNDENKFHNSPSYEYNDDEITTNSIPQFIGGPLHDAYVNNDTNILNFTVNDGKPNIDASDLSVSNANPITKDINKFSIFTKTTSTNNYDNTPHVQIVTAKNLFMTQIYILDPKTSKNFVDRVFDKGKNLKQYDLTKQTDTNLASAVTNRTSTGSVISKDIKRMSKVGSKIKNKLMPKMVPIPIKTSTNKVIQKKSHNNNVDPFKRELLQNTINKNVIKQFDKTKKYQRHITFVNKLHEAKIVRTTPFELPPNKIILNKPRFIEYKHNKIGGLVPQFVGTKPKGRKRVSIFSTRLNKLRGQIQPPAAATNIKYNTYQPPTKEDLEMLKYVPKSYQQPRGLLRSSCKELKTLRHQFQTEIEFQKFLIKSNCTIDIQTAPISNTNNIQNKIVHLPSQINNLRSNFVPKKVYKNAYFSSKEKIMESFENTHMFPIKVAEGQPVRPSSNVKWMKRLKLSNTRRKEMKTMNTQDFFTQHRLVTQGILRKYFKPRPTYPNKRPAVTSIPRLSMLRPKFDPIEGARFDRPKLFYRSRNDNEDVYHNQYNAHHHPDSWKQKIDFVQAALQKEVVTPKPPKLVNNVIDRPYIPTNTNWNTRKFRDKIDSIRNVLYKADLMKASRTGYQNSFMNPIHSDDPYSQSDFHPWRNSGPAHETTKREITKRHVSPRHPRTIFFLSPTVSYSFEHNYDSRFD